MKLPHKINIFILLIFMLNMMLADYPFRYIEDYNYRLLENIKSDYKPYTNTLNLDPYLTEEIQQLYKNCSRINSCIYTNIDIDDDSMISMLCTLDGYTPNSFARFLSEDGIIVISDNFHSAIKKYFNDDDNQVVGFFKRLNSTPIIFLDANSFIDYEFVKNEILHEMAHYMDDSFGITKTKEFKKYFKHYSKSYEPIEPKIPDDYPAENKEEYYACIFSDYITFPNFHPISKDVSNYLNSWYEYVEPNTGLNMIYYQ